MRLLTEEYKKQLEQDDIYNFILSTPKPDFTQLHKESKEFEQWISQEHEKERELLKSAVKNAD